MLHERRNEIVKMVYENRMIKVSDLVELFQVSIETIRRDLEYLEKKGYLKRVYGGAVLDGMYGKEPEYSHREVKNYIEKQAIGMTAAELVEDGDILFIDLGTTTLEVAKCLNTKKNLTVITNSIQVANEIINNDSNRVIVLGGLLRKGELSVSGFLCTESIKYFNADKAIIGLAGLTIHGGVTDFHIEEANNRRTMIERAEKVIAVTDYTKFGVTAMSNICPLSQVDMIVTDWNVPQKTIAEYKNVGTSVIIAKTKSIQI